MKTEFDSEDFFRETNVFLLEKRSGRALQDFTVIYSSLQAFTVIYRSFSRFYLEKETVLFQRNKEKKYGKKKNAKFI